MLDGSLVLSLEKPTLISTQSYQRIQKTWHITKVFGLSSGVILFTSFCTGRQRFLVDQGYSYDVIDHLPGMEEEGAVRPFGFSRPDEQEDLLTTILHNKYKDIDMNDDDDGGVDKVKKVTNDDDLDAFGAIEEEPSRKKARIEHLFNGCQSYVYQQVSMASLSGADGMVYQQFNKGSF